MKRKKFHHSPLVFTILCFSLLLTAVVFRNQTGNVEAFASEDEIIVKYKPNVSEETRERLRSDLGTVRKQRIDRIRAEVIKVPNKKVSELIEKYKRDPNVEYAELNYKAEKVGVSNDTFLPQQWGIFKINASNQTEQSAWDLTTGLPSVKVAILDTGIEEGHVDLLGKVTSSANFSDTATVSDLDGHGTHVAGIVAASTNNATGVAGVGYNSVLLNGKVLDDSGSGYYSWIINGIIWAADNGAQVINMSLSGSSSSLAMQDAVNYAWNRGVVVVAASGNNGSTSPRYPAYYTNVIAVGAVDSEDNKASFSNHGSWVDVAAPGVSVYSTYKGNSYANMSGTSMASPVTAGTAALVFAKGDCATNTCVRNQIEKTADQITGTGSYWTHGRINAYKAVQSLVLTPTPTAVPTPTPTPTPTPIQSGPTPTPTPSSLLSKINPIADSEVRGSSPGSNYGTRTQLDIDGAPIKIGYLKFDLAPLIGKTILSAKLRLRIVESSTSVQNIKSVADTSWLETGITYNNRPVLGSALGTIANGKSSTWKEIDVTSYILGKEGSMISFGIDSTGSNDLGFSTRNSSSNKPELVLTY